MFYWLWKFAVNILIAGLLCPIPLTPFTLAPRGEEEQKLSLVIWKAELEIQD